MNDFIHLIGTLPPEKKAVLAELLLRSLPDQKRTVSHEPIAIIGIGCRFPGGANTPADFWRLLRDGFDAVGRVPEDRWEVATPDHDPTNQGGFLDQPVDRFDAPFFHIAPREAAAIDPQQRLLLEVTWEALEDAGLVPERLSGSKTGVFIGIGINDYSQIQGSNGSVDAQLLDTYGATGNSFAIAANRLSYFFNFQGPSMALDTACSSSLVSIHLACQSLWNEEATLALAGGSNLILRPETSIKLRSFLSPDGRCQTFDERANGYVRGEGIGIVVLKPLAQAQADGDPIYATILSSAINQDGRSGGLTVPNGTAQRALIQEALKKAHVSPAQVDYIEAHGTGTALGDPIEVNALGSVLKEGRTPDQLCSLGTVKTNIGHLEAAAGIAGVIKVALSLKMRELVPSIHFRAPNPNISFKELPLKVQQTVTPWPEHKDGRPSIAGVSAFGFGGTNAHLVLSEAPHRTTREPASVQPEATVPLILPISARTPEALHALAQAYQRFLSDPGHTASLHDIVYSASEHRSQFAHRLALIGANRQTIADTLTTYLQEGNAVGAISHQISPTRIPLAFIFSGQGAQWVGMGKELIDQEVVFKEALERCDQALSHYASWSIRDLLTNPMNEELLERTEYAQPVICALQIALVALWHHWGIEPDAVVGHSMGEIAAAYTAGVYQLEDAIYLAWQRGSIMQDTYGSGKMAAIGLTAEESARLIAPYAGQLSISAYNDPGSTVIAGAAERVEQLVLELQQQGIFARIISQHYAFHSAYMDECQRRMSEIMHPITVQRARIPFISTVTGTLQEQQHWDATYWGKNIREPVHFVQALTTLTAKKEHIFVEIGPHPVLQRAISDTIQARGQQVRVVPSLRRRQSEKDILQYSLATLYTYGCTLKWHTIQGAGAQFTSLPYYQWQRESYWLNTDNKTKLYTAAAPVEVQHKDLYEIDWIPKVKVSQKQPYSPGRWLIFADEKGLGQTLAHQLEARGDQCELVYTTIDMLVPDDPTQRIRPNDAETITRVVHAFNAAGNSRGIIHLWSLNSVQEEELTPQKLAIEQEIHLASLILITQALIQAGATTARLWAVTAGAQSIDANEAPVSLSQSTVWGLGRVITLEHPELWGGLIDLPIATDNNAVIDPLIQHIDTPDDEDQIVLRHGQRFVPRLHQRSHLSQRTFRIRPDGAYLITGGSGGLGLKIAAWLVKQGAHHLYLLSRKGLPVDADNQPQSLAFQELMQQGIQIESIAADVSNAQDMARTMKYIQDQEIPLCGIIHAAGISTHHALKELSWQDVVAVMQPKVQGAWLLHTLSQQCSLDFCVLFSSAAASWGLRDSAHYAAANHFLDALAQYRQVRHQPTISINWGPWEAEGMATDEVQRWFNQIGVKPLQPEQAFNALQVAWSGGQAVHTIAEVQWKTFQPIYEAKKRRPLLEDLVTELSQESIGIKTTKTHDFVLQLQKLHAGEQKALLTTAVHQVVCAVLNIVNTARLGVREHFTDMGMDSLMAVEIQQRLQSLLGISLPSTVAFNYSSVETLVTYLLKVILQTQPQSQEPGSSKASSQRASTPTSFDQDISQLSEQEAELLLLQELVNISGDL